MKYDYYIVHRDFLPVHIDKIVEAVELLNEGKVKTVSEAAKRAGISRSTFYKYKDMIFASASGVVRKCIFSVNLAHQSGVLSSVLNVIAESGGNVLTIHQDIPIRNSAYVTISLDVTYLNADVKDLLKAISALPGATNAKLIAMD